MRTPRRVTTPSGGFRWQVSSGSTYATYEDAVQAEKLAESSDVTAPDQKPNAGQAKLSDGLVVSLLAGGAVTAVPYFFWNGQLVLKPHYEWLYLLAPFILLFLLGMFIDGVREVRAWAYNKNEYFHASKATDWITGKLFPNIFLVIIVIFSFYGLLILLDNMFSGVSKEAKIISILLFLILIALIRRRN